jgi:hypothetical protein
MGFAIGPSRVDPRTGQILDADIVMDEGFITSWINAWEKLVPQIAMESFEPRSLAWLAQRPQWDPRILLAPPAQRAQVRARLQQEAMAGLQPFAGHPAANVGTPHLLGDDQYDGLAGRLSQVNGQCMHAMAKSMDVALYRLSPDIFAELARLSDEDDDDDDADDDDGDDEDENGDDDDDENGDDDDDESVLDGIPEAFIGPLLRDVIMHEVGHTLGLRHNFKASTIRSLAEINTEAYRGQAQTGSVMDYNPININVEDGPVQGDYTMVTIGPYDYWAIEYGYTASNDLKAILSRVAEADLAYATDEDTWGPDPKTRRFDYGADPLNYAESQLRLVKTLRPEILDRMVEDGESWSKARQAYDILLSRHFGSVAIAANWLGGSYVNRDKKGDPGDRDPVVPVEAEQQRRALQFVIDSMFEDEAFGLTPELLAKMTVDKWWDEGGMTSIFEDPAWPVHDRVSSLQAVALTLVMNPTTLNRVYDLEFRIPADEDALTVADVMLGVTDSIWREIDKRPGKSYSARKPMVSSLRRNLQREHIERLIDLSMPNQSFGPASRPVSNLSLWVLRDVHGKLEGILDRHESKLDPYTKAHFGEAVVRISKALDAQYIYNTDDMKSGAMPQIMFMEPSTQDTHEH